MPGSLWTAPSIAEWSRLLRSAVEPLQSVEPVLVGFLAQQRIPKRRVRTSGMVDVLTDLARLQLQACGAQDALPVVIDEGALDVAIGRLSTFGEAHRVLEGHAGALREVLQHRMRRVTEQHDAALRPSLHRIAIAQHPHLPVGTVSNDVLHVLVRMAKTVE